MYFRRHGTGVRRLHADGRRGRVAGARAHEVAGLGPAFDHAHAFQLDVGAQHRGDAQLVLLAGLAHGGDAFAGQEHALGDQLLDVANELFIQFHAMVSIFILALRHCIIVQFMTTYSYSCRMLLK